MGVFDWLKAGAALLLSAGIAGAEPVPVELKDFPTAESHLMMRVTLDTYDNLGKWYHFREFSPIDEQTIVRMNRDTLYSSIVLDLTEPATLVMPEGDGRYQMLLVVNEQHFARKAIYEPGEHLLTQEDMGSRYVFVIARTLVNASDPEDLARAHAVQDGLGVIQADPGSFEVPAWDQEQLGQLRDALRTLGLFLSNRERGFGAGPEDVDMLPYLVSAADGWGGSPKEHSIFVGIVPEEDSGKTAYEMTFRDVPAGPDAFWSISIYNAEGYFVKNEYGIYSINNTVAEKNEDGSTTIRFGGDPEAPNFLPLPEGWNATMRIYQAQEAYFDGSWTMPELEPVE